MADGSFKVVIVGGGVAGLTLANMLEKFDIDYILLESRGDISSAVGASIGMLPNGLRILDQIGCYERIEALPQQPITSTHTRDSTGKSLIHIANVSKHLKNRHGYPVLFFDRHWLLRLLYENLQHKERVTTNMKVSKVQQADGGIQVITKDGKVVKGTLVIGADGVHSHVRQQMIRMGDEQQPGYFPPGESDRVPCFYRCSFGIAQHVVGYTPGEVNNVRAKGWSGLVMSGPEGRVYWFMHQRLHEPRYGKDIPRYTEEDELQYVKEFWDCAITDKIKFGDIYSKKLTSTLTPLHEYVYEKWFFNRIMLLGDSAHKPNPLSGQGGNGAIESVAELVNAIVRMRDTRTNGLEGLNDEEIGRIFQQTQTARHEREKYLIAEAHKLQALSAYENHALSTLTWQVIGPIAGDEYALALNGKPALDAARLEKLPIPHRARITPFTDELPARPKSMKMGRAVQGCFAAGMASLIWLAGKSLRLPAAELGGWAGGAAISRPWSNVGGGLLKEIVSFFSYPVEGQPVASKLHIIYFLTQLASPILSYTVDGYRKGNRMSALVFPSVFLGVMQVTGIAFVAPAHALIGALQGDITPTGRRISPETSGALLPALALGYAVPTALMLAPGFSTPTKQDLTALWQFSPVLVPAFTSLFEAGSRWLHRKRHGQWQQVPATDKGSESLQQHAVNNTKSLRTVYTCTAVVQAAVHLSTLAIACWDQSISLSDMFFGVPNPMQAEWGLPSTAIKASVFLKYDMIIATGALFARDLYSIWDLRRHGYIQTREAVKAVIGTCLGQVVIGSGATSMILAYWQERAVAGLSKRSV
ncbi:putative FAD-binding domain-containing protein [Seiridium cardinale]|uniref:FAD-binding domain-containing protein n=1 Tax=Seiridium cardinale TaxID=138064 RepID=A0ABR2XSX6_9PEZI